MIRIIQKINDLVLHKKSCYHDHATVHLSINQIMFDFWRRCVARGSRGLFPKSDFPRIISVMSNYQLGEEGRSTRPRTKEREIYREQF